MDPDVSIVDLLSSPAFVRSRTGTQPFETPIISLISSDPASSPVKPRWYLSSDSENARFSADEDASPIKFPIATEKRISQNQQDDLINQEREGQATTSLKRTTRPWDDPYESDFSIFSSPPPEPLNAPSSNLETLPLLLAGGAPDEPPTKVPATSEPAKRKRSNAKSNVLKKGWSRLETVKDMICYISTADPTKWQHIVDSLHGAGAQVHVNGTASLHEGFKPFEVVVELKRSTEDVFDEANRYFVKTSRHFLNEPTKILVFEFSSHTMQTAELLSSEWAETIKNCYRDHVQSSGGTSQIVFLVVGVKAALRRYQQQYNRAIQRQVRAALSREGELQAPHHTVDPNTLQRAVIKLQAQLQIECPAHVLYPDDAKHTQTWIADLVRDISYKRYSERLVTPQTMGKRFPSIAKPTLKDLLRPVPGISPAVAQRLEDKYKSLARLSQCAQDGTLNLDDVRGGSAIVLQRLLNLTCSTDPSAALAAST